MRTTQEGNGGGSLSASPSASSLASTASLLFPCADLGEGREEPQVTARAAPNHVDDEQANAADGGGSAAKDFNAGAYLLWHKRAVLQRTRVGNGRSHEMNRLYNFWVSFLQDGFNETMYGSFKRYAEEDASAGHNYGLSCLFQFYHAYLASDFDLEMFKEFEALALKYQDYLDYTEGMDRLCSLLVAGRVGPSSLPPPPGPSHPRSLPADTPLGEGSAPLVMKPTCADVDTASQPPHTSSSASPSLAVPVNGVPSGKGDDALATPRTQAREKSEGGSLGDDTLPVAPSLPAPNSAPVPSCRLPPPPSVSAEAAAASHTPPPSPSPSSSLGAPPGPAPPSASCLLYDVNVELDPRVLDYLAVWNRARSQAEAAAAMYHHQHHSHSHAHSMHQGGGRRDGAGQQYHHHHPRYPSAATHGEEVGAGGLDSGMHDVQLSASLTGSSDTGEASGMYGMSPTPYNRAMGGPGGGWGHPPPHRHHHSQQGQDHAHGTYRHGGSRGASPGGAQGLAHSGSPPPGTGDGGEEAAMLLKVGSAPSAGLPTSARIKRSKNRPASATRGKQQLGGPGVVYGSSPVLTGCYIPSPHAHLSAPLSAAAGTSGAGSSGFTPRARQQAPSPRGADKKPGKQPGGGARAAVAGLSPPACRPPGNAKAVRGVAQASSVPMHRAGRVRAMSPPAAPPWEAQPCHTLGGATAELARSLPTRLGELFGD